MRKTVSISISGLLFHVEEQAYKQLEEYLGSIRSHFASYEDRDEIVSDIENRIAEHFSEKLSKSRKVLNEKDVTELIEHMGTVKDFEAFEGDVYEHSAKHDDFAGSKRLYRDPENKMLAGVASGIANYFGIDPTIVRLLFAVFTFFGGAGIPAYIILWVVMPEAKTTSEKVEMRGQQLTLKRIEATIRENIPSVKDRIKPGTLTRIIQFPFTILRQILNFIGRILKIVVPLIARLIGVAIMIGAIIGLFALTFAFIMLITNAWEAHMDVPVRQLAGNSVYYTALISGYIAIFLPGALFVLLGISLMLMRNIFRFPIVISLIGVWIVALMVGAVTIASDAPEFTQKVDQYIESHKTEAAKTIPVEAFRSIKARGHYDVRITHGTGTTVRVSGTEMAVAEIKAAVENDTLIIEGENNRRFCIICLGGTTVVDVTVPGTLANIEASADANIDVRGVDITGEKILSTAGTRVVIRNARMPQILTIQAMAGSRIDIQALNGITTLNADATAGSRVIYSGEVQTVTVTLQAGSAAELSGTGSSLTANVTSGSDLEAVPFVVTDAEVHVMAGGRAEVNVLNSLTGSAHAGGSIHYTGNATSINVDTDPSGDIRKTDENDFVDEYQE